MFSEWEMPHIITIVILLLFLIHKACGTLYIYFIKIQKSFLLMITVYFFHIMRLYKYKHNLEGAEKMLLVMETGGKH
jgi:hypothetical protein